MGKRETSIERLLHRLEDHIDEWRGRMSTREMELQAHRGMLLAEAAERERLLARSTGEEDQELSLEEAAKEHRVAFVVHSDEAGKVLEKFAGEGARLVKMLPGSGGEGSGADIKGSWLMFG